MSKEKPSKTEDEYFAKEEAEKKKRLAKTITDQQTKEERKKIQEFCYLKCPKCGGQLAELLYTGIQIEKCSDCLGVWLDDGELEKIAGDHSGNVIKDILNLFK
jgi:uncharacterized protein